MNVAQKSAPAKVVDRRHGTKKTGGIAEILAAGAFPNTYNFRVPQAWSCWRHGKSIANNNPRRGNRAFSIQTERGKDEKPPAAAQNYVNP